ncbi:unnamed protein product [Echinostoma caproni]|uniref:Carboxypeptidase n=1 Tax=Echinostoma caproni TaxID=27848 RepID=A0A183AQX5_9TREM|nr:unnamed protein product [Echinostoma caproni]
MNTESLSRPLSRETDFVSITRTLDTDWPGVELPVTLSLVWPACRAVYRGVAAVVSKQPQVPTLIYNGDVDMACNYFGDLWFVDSLGLTVTQNLTRWLYVDYDGTKQVGGTFKILKHDATPLWFVTVRGSGHMVPHDKPIAASHLIQRFIQGGPLSA